MMSHCDASVLVIFQQTQPFLDILFHVYKRYYTALNSDYSAPYLIRRWALNKYFRKILVLLLHVSYLYLKYNLQKLAARVLCQINKHLYKA